MKNKKKFEDWCNKKLDLIQQKLLLQSYLLRPVVIINDSSIYAQLKFSYPYKNIRVEISSDVYDMWEKGEHKKIEGYLVHEMVHVITDGLYSKSIDRFVGKNEIEDERETLTEHISNIIIKSDLLTKNK